MDKVKEFAEDFRDNWDNAYWWADHQLLQTILACTVIGLMGLAFKYAELQMTAKMGAPT